MEYAFKLERLSKSKIRKRKNQDKIDKWAENVSMSFYKWTPLHSIINSLWLDADRIDSYMRDFYFTGHALGSIRLDYLISNFRLGKIQANHNCTGKQRKWVVAIDERALPIVESILTQRHLIYGKFYLHPKVVITEALFKRIIRGIIQIWVNSKNKRSLGHLYRVLRKRSDKEFMEFIQRYANRVDSKNATEMWFKWLNLHQRPMHKLLYEIIARNQSQNLNEIKSIAKLDKEIKGIVESKLKLGRINENDLIIEIRERPPTIDFKSIPVYLDVHKSVVRYLNYKGEKLNPDVNNTRIVRVYIALRPSITFYRLRDKMILRSISNNIITFLKSHGLKEIHIKRAYPAIDLSGWVSSTPSGDVHTIRRQSKL